MKANAKTQFVTVSGGSIELMRTVWGTATGREKTILQIVTFVENIGFTGAELDFEQFGSWTTEDFTNYKLYVKTLGAALHSYGRKLMISVPLITKDTAAIYALKLRDFDAFPELDFITVMAYDYMWDYGCGTARSPHVWFQAGISWIQSQITDKSRIIIGIASDCYTCTAGNYDMRYRSFAEVKAAQPKLATATRDIDGELNWVDGNTVYNCVDLQGVQAKVDLAVSMGVESVAIWYVGGGDGFIPLSSMANIGSSKTTSSLPAPTVSAPVAMTCSCPLETKTITVTQAPMTTTTTTVIVAPKTTTTTTTIPSPTQSSTFEIITTFDKLYTNSLAKLQGDDQSLSKYVLNANGGINFAARLNSYWYTILATPTTCYSTTASFIRITGTGFISAQAKLTLTLQTSKLLTGCDRSGPLFARIVSTWIRDPSTGLEIGEIPLSSMTGLKKDKLWAIVVTNVFPLGATFVLRSLSLESTAYSVSV